MEAGPSFAAAADQVRRGEWTSYGDVAAAAGRPRGARAVGRAAASSADFPHAHRVLRADGSITRGPGQRNRDHEARIRGLLEAEGLTFSAGGKADPRRRVYWDELQRRLDETPRAVSR